MQNALDRLWMFSGELFDTHPREAALRDAGIAPDLELVKQQAASKIEKVLAEATLKIPDNDWMQTGGKNGKHSEHIGHLLTELQYMQRVYPGLEW